MTCVEYENGICTKQAVPHHVVQRSCAECFGSCVLSSGHPVVSLAHCVMAVSKPPHASPSCHTLAMVGLPAGQFWVWVCGGWWVKAETPQTTPSPPTCLPADQRPSSTLGHPHPAPIVFAFLNAPSSPSANPPVTGIAIPCAPLPVLIPNSTVEPTVRAGGCAQADDTLHLSQ